MNPCKLLLKFSRTRQSNFEHSGFKTGAKMAAISKIQRVAGFFSTKPPAVQLRAVNQVRREIIEILPSEQSRFHKIRQTMLDLLDRAQQQQYESL